MKRAFSEEYLVRRYFSGTHATYTGMLHDLKTDEHLGQHKTEAMRDFLNSLTDRTPIKLTIEVIGKTKDDYPRWAQTGRPGVYGPEPENGKRYGNKDQIRREITPHDVLSELNSKAVCEMCNPEVIFESVDKLVDHVWEMHNTA